MRIDDGSESSEDERPPRNTVGDVPLVWYKDEQHIGYDRDAKKLIRRAKKDKLDTLLAQTDTKQASRTIYDEYNDEEIVLSKDELRLIQRIRQGQFPHVEVRESIACVASVVCCLTPAHHPKIACSRWTGACHAEHISVLCNTSHYFRVCCVPICQELTDDDRHLSVPSETSMTRQPVNLVKLKSILLCAAYVTRPAQSASMDPILCIMLYPILKLLARLMMIYTCPYHQSVL